MANKGLWIDLEHTRSLWSSAYVPLTNKELTIVSLTSTENYNISEVKMAYSPKGVAIFATGHIPNVLLRTEWEDIEKKEELDVISEALCAPTIWLPGPIKTTITKVSRKQGNIIFHGDSGEIRIWQRATSRKKNRFIRHEWGMEIGIDDAYFTKRGQQGKILDLQKLIDTYEKMGALYKLC